MIIKRFSLFIFIVPLVLIVAPLSCSLDPLNGFLPNLNIQVLSVSRSSKMNNKMNNLTDSVGLLAVPSVVPHDAPTSAADFHCIAFSVTGYGIEEKENVVGSKIPFASLRLGFETEMQNLSLNSDLNFSVKVPTLLGVDPNLQKRQIQLFGVYTSLADTTSCVGKTLYDFLLKDDPNAAVYLIGSEYYPNTMACANGSLCIRDDIFFNGTPGAELIYYHLTPSSLFPIAVFEGGNLPSTIPLFLNSDLNSGRGVEKSGSQPTYTSRPTLSGRTARLDFYFPISKYIMNRMVTGYANVVFRQLRAINYSVSGSTCASTAIASSYSNLQMKIWNGTSQAWMNVPRDGLVNDLIIPSANVLAYSINFVELSGDSVQTQLINGVEYLIMSMRTTEHACSSISLSGAPQIQFY